MQLSLFEPWQNNQKALRHRSGISSKEAVLLWRNDAEVGPTNSLQASGNTASIFKF